jgi:hypothetical protein
MRQHKLVATVLRQLARLGDTAAEVAASLKESECQGDDSADGHPIACYMQARLLPDIRSLIVEAGDVVLIDKSSKEIRIPLPPACVEFDRMFRIGGFPECEEGLFR